MEELRPQTTLSHYRIVSKLGAGGMGEVYLAQDTKLDRKVAIKILPADVASQHDRMERFVREARSAAALNHPNIAHVYEIGESDGTHFIAMEFIDGETLREKIHRDKAPLSKLLKYLNQVAEGLSKAHSAGIVHRDLKPDNIMITRDDYAKVLDFGLAKLIEGEGEAGTGGGGEDPTIALSPRRPVSPSLSTPGIVMGTVGYMSPEQASGRINEIDHRSDIFSFGCILFEAATGKRAFEGKDALDSLHKIVHAPTPQLKDVNPFAPADLQRVVRRCLAKEPEKRYQSIKELAIELDDLQQELKGFAGLDYSRSPASPTIATTSGASRTDEGFRVAVLPFQSRDADPAVSALADGLSEEIVTGLSRFRYLSVVTSTSAARLKGQTEDERSLGAKLGTRYVLEGSIRKGGSAIRVSAQLVDTETGAQLWSETYNRDLQTLTIFAVQDDVAGRIVATVADSYGVLVHSMRAAIRQKDDADLTPVEWQFQYFAYREQITPSAHAALKSRLERVAKRNDHQSDLWACLAQIYVDEYAFGFQDDATSLDRALAAGRRGVELDRANQFALVALAQVHFFRQDLAAFGPAAERAMALNPLNTDALGILGLQIVHTGEFERGTAIVHRAMELNTNHAGWMHFAPLWDHFHKGEYEQALECANRVDVPGLFWPFLVMASACGHLGRRTEAEAAVKDLLALDPEFAARARSNVGTWHFASGLMDPLLEGLRKAGLEIANEQSTSTRSGPILPSSETRVDEGFWVAVLPFKYRGSNADLEALTEGLSEDIITGLSRFSCLRVIARSSTLRFTNESTDVRSIGQQLGARYVMEGSLRQVGTMLRLVVQLVDASTGAHLWAETYDRAVENDQLFALQDDLVPRIVSTVADWYGVLTHSMSEAVRLKPIDQVTPYEAVLRSFGYYERVTAEEHALARSALERAVEQAPGNADGWAMLSMMYGEEFRFGFNEQPDPMGRSLRAARRAVDVAPSNHFAYLALAQALFFRKEFDAFRHTAERAIALNSMDGSTMEYVSHLIAFSGDWDYGCEVAERARQLNPNHPGWYWAVPFYNAYRNGDYPTARAFALKIDQPTVDLCQVMLAAVYGQLGEHEAADRTVQTLLSLTPDTAVTRKQLDKWYQPELVEKLIDGLRKAGLNIDEQAAPSLSGSASTEIRSRDGFWIAVLPFKFTGSSAEVATLAEGLSEEIVTGLSRFSYLRVISRSSTLRSASETDDVRAVGKTLGARYVMEGSLRLAGSMLRLAVQLVDASTGAHLWAETYDRPFRAEDIFALQDDLVPRIVSTVADQYGALVHSMSESLRGRSAGQYSAHEAVLRAFGYWERMTPEEHAEVRDILEAAVAVAPDHSECLAELAFIYWHEYAFGYNLRPDPIGRARVAAQRAVASAPTSHFAHCALATSLFFQKDYLAFRSAAERALALNRMDSSTAAILGNMIAYAGDWEYGLGIVERAMQLNPHHAGWYHYVAFCDAYRKHDYRGALASALKVNMPAYHWPHVYLAAVYGQLGEQQRARTALRELDALVPNFGSIAREEFGKWLDAELTEHLLDGLRKAGLEIADEGRPAGASPALHASGETRTDEGFWIAVLPFKFTGSNPEVATLGEGLSEEIVTGLSRFSYLRVISRSSTLRYATETSDVRTVGKTLGARYVIEGSLRVAGSSLRTSVQLIDASTGAHLWAETYDRQFLADDVFALQDDLVPRIVSTVADVNGVLPRSMCDVVCNKNPDELSPYEAVLRSFRYFDRVSAEELAAARACLEIAVKKAPTYADAWAMLALLFHQDYGQGFDLQPDALNLGIMAAQRAVESGPSNHLAYFSLAQARFFQKDVQSFRNAAERTVALNPMDANSLAFMGELLTYVGDSERGLSLATRAKEINPNHPGWFWYADYFHAYRQGDYRSALSLILKANLPGHWGMHAGIAAANGQLGELEAATKAVRDLLKLRPDYGATVHNTLAKWFDPELCEQLLDGLRKAGLEIASEEPGAQHVSSEKRADEGFWVAVLPFKAVGPSTELETLALGMTEEIVTGFSRFSYLRVMALGSTMKHSQSGDLRQIGAELGARYVMEGSIRQAGSTVRLAVQLVDTSNGAHLWAETFDRQFQHDQIFAMQDELIPRIVSTCADHFGVLARSISDAIRGKDSSQLSPYEALMCGFGYHYRLNPQEHAEARRVLERAVTDAPNNADCWAMLSWIYSHEYGHGFNTQPGSLDRALAAARRAVDLAPTNHLAYQTLAVALFFRKERANCLSAAERAMTLNPLDASNEAIFLITFVDDWERGCSLIERAMDLNPYVPGWYRVILAVNEYRKGSYREAVSETVKANAPGIWTDIVLSAAYAQLDEQAAARSALTNLIAENSAESVLELLTKWFDPELVEHLVEGLSKAGFEIGDDRSTTSSTAKSEATSATKESGDDERGETNATPSIAVLPFVNISNERENEYFCDGLAEELLNALSKIESLHVAARTSAFSFKGKQTDVREIGSTLSVSTVLEGSVRRSGNRVRISVQLVNVTDGYHLWSEKYDRQLEDIFDIQDEISLAIVAALKVKLLGAEQKVVKRYTENTEAYQLYLKGRFFVNQRTSESLLKAIEYFNKAIALDANYALGYAGLADAYLVLGVPDAVTEALSPRESLSKARAAAEKALQLDTSGGEVYAALAHIKWKERDWAGAESDYKRSIELNPNNPIAHFYYAVCLAGLGRKQQAIKEITRAQELDPLSLPVNASVVYVLYLCRKYDEAIEAGKRTLELDAAFPLTHQRLGLPYIQRKMYREAISEFQQAVNNSNRAPQPLVSLAHAYAVSGNKVKAHEVLDELKDLSKERYVSPYGVAIIHVGLEDKEQAFEWLERAYDEQNTELTFLRVDPRLDPLRDDPGFQALLKKVGFPQAAEVDGATDTISVNASPKLVSVPSFESRPAIAVLPFNNLSVDREQEYFADGLAEDLITRLSLWRSFPVIARNSSFVYKGKSVDIKKVSTDLGVRYVVEGSVRKAGNRVRISAQLIDATTGQHVWARTYDRELTDVFAVQDEISGAIAASLVGDLQHAEHERVQYRAPENLEAWDLYQRALPLIYRFTREDSARARALLERAIALEPKFSTARARLAEVGVWDFIFGWSDSPQQTLDAAVAQARRAVDLDPRNAEARSELAFALMTAGFGEEALEAARHGLDLNPCMPFALIVEGYLRNLSGSPPEESIKLMERAQQLSPHDPTEFLFYDILSASYMNAGRYAEGLTAGRRLVALMPNYYWGYLWSAMNAVGLGRLEEARAMIREARQVHPGLSLTMARQALGAMAPEVDHRFFEALRQAGLEDERDETTREGDGETRRKQSAIRPEMGDPQTVPGFDDRPAIAVVPFDNLSNDPEQDYFAEGLAEDLITRLSLWRSFPVIARNSSFVYKGKAVDLKKVSVVLGVRYVVEGSVRKANNQVRISAQLIDATLGQNVWAKTYDRELTDVFAVQDEISEAIAASLVGDLERAEHARVQRRAPENLEAWGLYQRALPLIYNFTREDCAQARTLLARAVEHDPHFATALARLAEVGVWEVLYEWTDSPERTLDASIAEARRAVVLDPLDAQARIALSFALMTAGDGRGALEESRHAVELNPSMPFALALYAYHRHIAGYPPEESIGSVRRALRLSPHDPVEWLFYDVLSGAYFNAGRFVEGLEAGQRLIVLSPNYYWGYLWSAMNEVGLGRIEEARELVAQARRVKPELSFELARKCLGTMAPDVDRRFTAALRQSGLEEKRADTKRDGDSETGGAGDGESGGRGEAGKEIPPISLSPRPPVSSSSRLPISLSSSGSSIKTIAVLPFQNLSGDPEQDYFADGITEEIINALAQIPGLRVAGRSSAFSFKGRNEDLRTVGAKLGVSNILEGTLRRSGDRLRITAQLIDAGNGYQLWSERYDRVIDDVFAVQDEIADTIAGRLQVSLSASGEVQPAQPPTRHIGAYELYLKGRGLLYQRGLSIPKAIDCFTQAVALDPQYAQAWAGLADGYTTSGYSGFNRAMEVMPRALDAAKRALQLDPDLAEAHNALANATLLYERKFDVAESEFKRALELNPNYPQVHAWYGLFFLHWIAGRAREGREELLKLHRVDPLSGYANVIIAFSGFGSDQLSDAVDHARRGVELDPNSYLAQWCLSAALKCNGDYEEAEAAVVRALALSGRHCWALATLTSIYAGWGKLENARAAFRELESRSTREYIQPSMLIEAAAAIGEIDQAIAFAQQALDDRDPLFVLLARSWPGYDPLRTDSRFLKIVAQLGLPNWSITDNSEL